MSHELKASPSKSAPWTFVAESLMQYVQGAPRAEFGSSGMRNEIIRILRESTQIESPAQLMMEVYVTVGHLKSCENDLEESIERKEPVSVLEAKEVKACLGGIIERLEAAIGKRPANYQRHLKLTK